MFVKEKKLIDVLAEQGKLKSEVASVWKSLSNEEAEKKLKSEQMLSADDIVRAYSLLYNIPVVCLKGMQIPRETLELIPEDLAREYKIIAYEQEKQSRDEDTGSTVRIAVAEPAKLTSNLKDVLQDMERQKGFKIELAFTTLDDFSTAIAQYKTPAQNPKEQTALPPTPVVNIPVATPKGQLKTIDLDKIIIPYEVIAKFPQDIAHKYQMVVFESPHPSLIKVAIVDPDDEKIREILDFIKVKNDIAIDEYKVSPAEIHRAMRFYDPKEIERIQKAQQAPKMPPPPPPEEMPPPALEEKPPFKPEEAPKTPAQEEELQEKVRQMPKAPAPAQKTAAEKAEEKKALAAAQKEEIPEVIGPAKAQSLVLPGENDLDKFLGTPIKDVKDLQEIAETGHIPKIVAAAVVLAVSKKASDIHIEPGEKNLRVRFRIDGLLRDIIKLPLSIHPAIIARVKILSKLKIDETRIPQDGRFDCIATGHAIDLRISTLPTVHGEKIAMRILDKSAQIYTLEELGLAGQEMKVLLKNLNKPYGVILATGPTGSGKTTTLYAILNRISNASVNIITLEDPVEYEMAGLNQCQIKPKIGFSFANGLRSVLRQDPNIIMVGEIRDSETASLATHAALTGHLVLSTLHTNDAAGALPRLADMGVEPFFITSLVNAIIAQRLVRKLCQKCKRPAHIPEPILKEIEAELSKFNFPKPYKFFEGKGCSECELGYKGRIGIFEVLTMSAELEMKVLSKKPVSEIKAQTIKDGMVTMKQDGLIKALKGVTTVNEVLRVVTV